MRIETSQYFDSHDGTKLFYRHWTAVHSIPTANEDSLENQRLDPVDEPADLEQSGALESSFTESSFAQTQYDKKAVILFHRGHEHSGRMAHLVDELNLPDYDFFAWDARGHGQSPGMRGDSPSFGTSVKDIQSFVEHISAQYNIDIQNIAVVAQSVGAVLAATWVHDYAPNIRALCLASPAFDIKLYVPFARLGLRFLYALRGNFFINSYVKAGLLTHDEQRAKTYDTDALIAKAISVRMLLGLYDAADRIVDDAQAIYVPTQVLVSGSDFVVYRKPQEKFFQKLSNPFKELHILKGFYHDTLGEKNRSIATRKINRFIEQCFAMPAQQPFLVNADKIGQSCAIAEGFSEEVPARSFASLYWHIARKNLSIGSHFSNGLRVGQQTGFDSGSTLDYVYRNTADSASPLGRVIDRQYLNAIGWRGIRARKVNIEAMLKLAISHLQQAGQAVRIVDIAAGHGRYILEAIEGLEQKPEKVVLRDYSDINVRDGSELILQKGLSGVVEFVQADAFDYQSLANISPNPTLGVVSGLYELFSDNLMVLTSLQGLAAAIETGGYLIYTGQIWHPQQEFIARALTSHREGDAWVMRLRCQAEMDQLVQTAGFKKIEQYIDEFGIFTVSLAVRL